MGESPVLKTAQLQRGAGFFGVLPGIQSNPPPAAPILHFFTERAYLPGQARIIINDGSCGTGVKMIGYTCSVYDFTGLSINKVDLQEQQRQSQQREK